MRCSRLRCYFIRQQQWSFCPSLFQFQLSLAQPPKKLGHGRGSGESDLCDASISGDDREESGKFALHCPLDWEGHRLGTFRSYHRRVRQIQALVHYTGWQLFGTRPCVVVSRTPLSSSL
ncbi:hypothetical protein RIF29_45474 [Crotalaria pallida]|uniref:Uncharacterized protein n=1 Tax=Crotalaria pallida TaxID=3830 RepID=A0AAN9HL89_CROPI